MLFFSVFFMNVTTSSENVVNKIKKKRLYQNTYNVRIIHCRSNASLSVSKRRVIKEIWTKHLCIFFRGANTNFCMGSYSSGKSLKLFQNVDVKILPRVLLTGITTNLSKE